MSKPKLLSVETFIAMTTPCQTGQLYLRRFKTVHAAWNSRSASPDYMIWALAQCRFISDTALARLAGKLDKHNPPLLDTVCFEGVHALTASLKTRPIQTRWVRFPDLCWYSSRVVRLTAGVIRETFPDVFKITEDAFMRTLQKPMKGRL